MKTMPHALIGLPFVLALVGYAGGQTPPDASMTLETLRERVARNESLIDPIELSYTVQLSRTGEWTPPKGPVRPGRQYSHYRSVWAQSGSRQYVRLDYFYGPNEPARSEVTILDGKTKTTVDLPARMRCSIVTLGSTDWFHVFAAKLRLRPFEDHWRLSELLVPPHAILRNDVEVISGRPTRIVDMTAPDPHSGCVRLWIDPEAGIPLRTCVYDKHPTAPQASVICEVNEVKPYRLPNGGWIPITGLRAIHFRRANPPESAYERIAVDVNSIVTAVPDSLWRIDLPDGAVTYNDLSGVTTTKGQVPKTYEQIAGGHGRFLAGVVTDENGTPIRGVAVAPVAIATVQSDGRPGLRKLVQPHERICAITNAQGRFALEIEPQEKDSYYLTFCHNDYADEQLTGVAPDQHDLQIRLQRGGTVAGRAFFVANGKKIPLVDTEVSVQGGDRMVAGNMRHSRTLTTTDTQGRFEIGGLPVQTQDRSIPSSEPRRYVPLPWQVRCGAAMLVLANVTFEASGDRRELELVVRPSMDTASTLSGRPLPGWADLGLNLDPGSLQGRRLLVCFFDMEQRPGRNCVVALARRAARLQEQGVTILAVHEKGIDASRLKAWRAESAISFPVGTIAGDSDDVKFTWAVRSLPWLILTDRDHVVTAEGFDASEVEQKMTADGSSSDATENPDRVVVTITDNKGNALAHVHVTESETAEPYTTDGRGQFVCRPSDQTRWFYAVDKERRLAQAERFAPGQRQLRMELLPARVVSGRVTDPNGRPLAGVQIAPLPMTSFYVLTDADGQFDVGWQAAWEPRDDRSGLCLMARHVERNLAALVDISWEASRLDIQLTPALAVSGKVTAADGAPVPRATGWLWLEKWTWGCGTPVKEVTTDSRGRFCFQALPQLQTYTLRVAAEGYEVERLSTGAISSVKDQEEIPAIVLAKKTSAETADQTGRLRLRVVDEDGKPVDIASIQMWKHRPDSGAPAETVLVVSTDTPGLYETESIPLGKYHALSIPGEDCATFWQSDVQVQEKPGAALVCRLSRGGTIAGIVTDEKGKPIADLPVVVNSVLCRRDVRTDPNGRFEASHLPDTRYSVIAEPPAGSPYATAILPGGASCGARDLRLVVSPKKEVKSSSSLLGTSLWQWERATLPVERATSAGQRVLVCLFDMDQRPSRVCLQQLSKNASRLREKAVIVVAVQVTKVDRTRLDKWLQENSVDLPVGVVRDDENQTPSPWGMESLPYLILTDKGHVVRAEGFSLDELEARIQGEKEAGKP
jgi:protocatechuate 3,4-dioxygenase beta subunit